MIALLAAQPASAQVTITNFAAIGPDGGSASLAGFNANAINTIAGSNINGTILPSSNPPSSYTPLSGVFSSSSVVANTTSVNSWNGVVNPGGAYANETGNMLYFGSKISANPGTTFQATDVGLNGGGVGLIGTQAPGYLTSFSSTVVGYDSVSNTFYTAGSTAGVNLTDLYLVGQGAGFDGSSITDQASMNAFIDNLNSNLPLNVTGQYYVTQTSTSGQVDGPISNLDFVPEPASMVVLGLGVVGLFGYAYRRRRTTSAVCC